MTQRERDIVIRVRKCLTQMGAQQAIPTAAAEPLVVALSCLEYGDRLGAEREVAAAELALGRTKTPEQE